MTEPENKYLLEVCLEAASIAGMLAKRLECEPDNYAMARCIESHLLRACDQFDAEDSEAIHHKAVRALAEQITSVQAEKESEQ